MEDLELEQRINELKVNRGKVMQSMTRVLKVTVSLVKKLSQLEEKNQNIEYLAISSQFLEFLLGVAIEQLSSSTQEILFAGNPQTTLISNVTINEDRDTLGSLIIKLGYLTKDKKLIKDLESFKHNYRNIVTHHLFRKFDNLELANNELSAVVSSHEVVRLLNRVIALGMASTKELDTSLDKNPTLKQKLKIELTHEEQKSKSEALEAFKKFRNSRHKS